AFSTSAEEKPLSLQQTPINAIAEQTGVFTRTTLSSRQRGGRGRPPFPPRVIQRQCGEGSSIRCCRSGTAPKKRLYAFTRPALVIQHGRNSLLGFSLLRLIFAETIYGD